MITLSRVENIIHGLIVILIFRSVNMVQLQEEERLDALHRNGYEIIQNPKKFCFGMDAVLLTGFAKVKPGERMLDLGTGTGIIPILMEAKTKGTHFVGLEIQEESADMARRSVAHNHLQDKITITCGDIKEAGAIFGAEEYCKNRRGRYFSEYRRFKESKL